ncbi:MAG: Gfo/Idh/MocA family oxidoreductase [Rhodobacter sp.]|nr:Gfo/Idh/MocA family oxidoreductase [Rhodobacter sp.]
MKTVAVIGLGYFSQFHLDAWKSNPAARLVAVADLDADRVAQASAAHGVPGHPDLDSVLRGADPDIIDLVVPPAAQVRLISKCLRPGRIVICQKPFCTSLAEAEAITTRAEAAGATLIIHENFRFQPWHREIRRFVASGKLGRIYSARFALRPGDGRGERAYLARQPTFQTMPRFLVQETAVHLIDVFRWLFGPIAAVYADLRRLNPAIAGEDAGTLILTHENGVQSVFDGNRLADHVAEDSRRTMGEMQIEGEGGSLALDGDGRLWFRAFGSQSAKAVQVSFPVDRTRFGGGCVAALIDHVVKNRGTLQNTARDYLDVIRVCEAAYLSHDTGRRICLGEDG